jgi:hypothetical protein
VTAVEGLEGYLLLASGNRIETCALTRCPLGLARNAARASALLDFARCRDALLDWSDNSQPGPHPPIGIAHSLLQHHGDQHWRGRQPQRHHKLEAAALRCGFRSVSQFVGDAALVSPAEPSQLA